MEIMYVLLLTTHNIMSCYMPDILHNIRMETGYLTNILLIPGIFLPNIRPETGYLA